MPRILIGTNNSGKLAELRALLLPRGWTPVHPAGLGLALEVEETGSTYAENATLKANAFAAAAGMLALADDSGLEVDALGGRPGVHSARYGGAGTPPAEQIRLLLRELEDVPEERRTARFRSVVVIAAPDGRTWQSDGTIEGRVEHSPRGANGFGYDPIFLLPERGLTMAQLGDAAKNVISHRALAMQGALQHLDRLLRSGEAF
ncbi:MAG TPA: RdgB/HAM1 family non-canonical purine NTP pyrophosphatase [Dehalococcoidia bacterium]|nr:RdgB/HAM1 family non-canonical purine NTP pyrophosphatase [Dehalococcoidia bacterium]